MDIRHDEFFEELRVLFETLKDLVDKYDLGKEVCSAMLIGIIVPDEGTGKNQMKLAADFMVADEDELDELLGGGQYVYQQAQREIEANLSAEQAFYERPEAPSGLNLEDTENWGVDEWIDFIGGKKEDENE